MEINGQNLFSHKVKRRLARISVLLLRRVWGLRNIFTGGGCLGTQRDIWVSGRVIVRGRECCFGGSENLIKNDIQADENRLR